MAIQATFTYIFFGRLSLRVMSSGAAFVVLERHFPADLHLNSYVEEDRSVSGDQYLLVKGELSSL